MVAREYNPQGPSYSQQPSITSQALGQVAAQNVAGMFSTHVATPQAAVVGTTFKSDNGVLNNALKGLQGTLQNLAESKLQTAYLDGAAAVGLGYSEDQLEHNWLTRDWAVAGFRDTKGSLAIADYQAKATVDMQKLREQGPEKVQEYLQTNRNRIVPTIQSMSRQGREKAYTNLLAADRNIIETHTVERQKYIMDQVVSKITTSVSVGLDNLKGTSGTPAYDASLDNLYVTLLNDVMGEERLDMSQRQSLLVEAAEVALADGHLSLYQRLRGVQVGVDDQGNPQTLYNTLPFGEQIKLQRLYEQYSGQYRHETSESWWAAKTAADTNSGLTAAEYSSLVDEGVRNRYLSPSAGSAAKVAYAGRMQERYLGSQVADAFLRGDRDILSSVGSTPKEIARMAETELLGADASATERAALQLDVMTRTGDAGAAARYGELVSPAINGIIHGKAEDLDPSAVSLITGLNASIDVAKQGGFTNVLSNMMQTFDDDQRTFLTTVLNRIEYHGDLPEQALLYARQQVADNKAMTPSQKAARAQRETRNRDAFIELISNPTSTLSFGALVGLVKSDSQYNQLQSVAGHKGFRDGRFKSVREVEHVMLNNMAMSYYDRVAMDQGSVDPETMLAKVSASMDNHSIPITLDSGNLLGQDASTRLVLDEGTNWATWFGVQSQNYGKHHIGEALAAMTNPNDDTLQPVYQQADGAILVRYFSEDSQVPVRSDTIDPKAVGEYARQIRAQGDTKRVQVFGEGKTVSGQAGAAVTFNGDNTQGVDPEVMFRIRDNLVEFEGVTNRAYPDGGRKSVGVGINSGNNNFPEGEVVPNEVISSTFAKASDEAVGEALALLHAHGIEDRTSNGALVELAANLKFQYGWESWTKTIGPFIVESAKGSPNLEFEYFEARQMGKLKALNAYKKSSKARQKMYRQNLSRVVRAAYQR